MNTIFHAIGIVIYFIQMIRFFAIFSETVAYFELMISRAYIAIIVIFTCWWIGIGFVGSIMTIL